MILHPVPTSGGGPIVRDPCMVYAECRLFVLVRDPSWVKRGRGSGTNRLGPIDNFKQDCIDTGCVQPVCRWPLGRFGNCGAGCHWSSWRDLQPYYDHRWRWQLVHVSARLLHQ